MTTGECVIFWEEKPSAASRFFRKAEEKNTQLMRAKTVEEHRAAKQKLAEVRPIPPGVAAVPALVGGVPCEWIYREGKTDRKKVIVYVHGGSWCFGNLTTARPVGVLLEELSDVSVLVVGYRLSPEHPYPAPLEDCHAVYRALLEQGFQPGDIGLMGDSAGGNLVLCLAHLLSGQGEPLPAAIACASPVTDLTLDSAIWQEGPDLIFTVHDEREQDVFSLYAGLHPRTLPTISPLMGDLSKLPPVLIHVGREEPLWVDNTAFARRGQGVGAQIVCKVWKEMFHDFSIVGVTLRESRLSLKEMTDMLRSHLYTSGDQ